MYINKICRNTEISVSIQNKLKKKSGTGNSLAVQWLGLHTFTAKDAGSIPSQGTAIMQAMWHS